MHYYVAKIDLIGQFIEVFKQLIDNNSNITLL